MNTGHSKRTIVHMVRHAEVHNPDKILYGRLPGYRLSARGRGMAAAAAWALTGHDVTYLASSPIQRAQESAQPIASNLNLPLQTDEDLIEAGNTLQGLHVKGWASDLWNPRYWNRLTNPAEPSWGEPYSVIAERMQRAVERARQQAEGHEAVLVTHQLPIWAYRRQVQGLPLAHNPGNRQCALSSITSFTFLGDTVVDMHYCEPAGRK
ncbi:histidine phosphatase family protein [Corynebacterium ulceribovis]|uniref:histidine phosphatase family protein n=1 Tax=Corynebacterium ulceribovis TaxID=487732 RepID=UPI00035C4D2F|nr:histidine phosphatase family protein [Corynebacterium ulceribovis]